MIFVGDFDEGGPGKAVTMLGPRRFVNHAVINLIEDDDGFNGDEDYLEPVWEHEERLPSPHPILLAPLDPSSARTEGVFRWTNVVTPDLADLPGFDYDYSYRMELLLAHEPE